MSDYNVYDSEVDQVLLKLTRLINKIERFKYLDPVVQENGKFFEECSQKKQTWLDEVTRSDNVVKKNTIKSEKEIL